MDSGDTAFMLVATALVMFMTPGLALFYDCRIPDHILWQYS